MEVLHLSNNGYIWRGRKRTIFGLPLSFTVYTLRDDKLLVKTGFIATQEEEIRLYRILDFTVRKTFWGRIFGLGMIELHTADRSTPNYLMKGIKKVDQIKEVISQMVEEERTRKNITSREFFSDDSEEN